MSTYMNFEAKNQKNNQFCSLNFPLNLVTMTWIVE